VDASDHSATIRWETNDKAATTVKYGTDKNNLDKQARHSGGARDHNVTLAELQPNTKYYYQILKTDGTVRGGGEFTTKGSGQSASGGGSGSGSSNGSSGQDNVVITEGPRVELGPDGTAKIIWKTDDIAASDVKYGTDQNNPQQRAYKPGGAREHEADLKNLQARQTYFFQILKRDGSPRTTGQFQYQPQSAGAATPGPAAGAAQQGALQFTVGPSLDTVADRAATINWQTNNVSNTIVHYGTDPKNLNQVGTGAWGTSHSAQLSNLNPNTRYYFQVESSPSAGNAVRSGVASFTTVAPGAQAMKNPPLTQ